MTVCNQEKTDENDDEERTRIALDTVCDCTDDDVNGCGGMASGWQRSGGAAPCLAMERSAVSQQDYFVVTTVSASK